MDFGKLRTTLDGMAYALWTTAWFDSHPTWPQTKEPPWPRGADAAAKRAAKDLEDLYVNANNGRSLKQLQKLQGTTHARNDAGIFGFMLVENALDITGERERDGRLDTISGGVKVPEFTVKLDGDELVWEGDQQGSKRARRNPSPTDEALGINPSCATPNPNLPQDRFHSASGLYLVLRVDGDRSDTYAVPFEGKNADDRDAVDEAVSDALMAAVPDEGAYLEYAIVAAKDAGWARIMPTAVFEAYGRYHSDDPGPEDMGGGEQTNPAVRRTRDSVPTFTYRGTTFMRGDIVRHPEYGSGRVDVISTRNAASDPYVQVIGAMREDDFRAPISSLTLVRSGRPPGVPNPKAMRRR